MRTITIIVDGDAACGFDVQESGKSCDGLSWDEMLGQVASMTIPKNRVGSLFSMRTPEEWKAEEQRLAAARAEIAAAQRALDEAKAEEQSRTAAESAATKKVIDDAAAETARAANEAAANALHELAGKRAAEALAERSAMAERPATQNMVVCEIDPPSPADALRHEINEITEQMTVAELNLVLHFCNRSILGRQVAA